MYTHTQTRTRTFCVFSLLFSAFLLNRDTQEMEGTREREGAKTRVCTDIDSSSDNSSITPCVWVFLRVFANVCVCPGACVRCVSQDCQHISSQREPYRNRDICGVKGRQLAWPSLEKEEDGKRRGAGRGTGRRMEESRQELQTLPIIRGGVLSRLDRDENV